VKNLVPSILLVLSGIYLLNFTVGVFELPDYLPLVGNLDEAAASLVFISSLKHFGIDLTEYLPFVNRRKRGTVGSPKPQMPQQ
jgi:hypothetical protein